MNTLPPRPRRTAIADALGRRITLNSGPEAFHITGPFHAGTEKTPLLLLGTGPEPDAVAAWLARQFPVEKAARAGSSGVCSPALGGDLFSQSPCPAPVVCSQAFGNGCVPASVRTAVRVCSPALGVDSRTVFWLEAPRVTAALRDASPSFPRTMPPHWQAVSPAEARRLLPLARIVWFRQNCRVDEPFWRDMHGALLALEGGVPLECVQGTPPPHAKSIPELPHAAAPVPAALCPPPQRFVLLPADADTLLSRELDMAFRELGFTPLALPARPDVHALAGVLERTTPALCCAVNFRGFDGEGAVFHLLRACGVPCAAWLVDNPWHLLSALSQPWWQELTLFVTDDSFITPLQQYGARQVHHLPLAAAQHMQAEGRRTALIRPEAVLWQWPAAEAKHMAGCRTTNTALPCTAPGNAPLLFVGSSRFTGKDQFFAAARVPDALLREGGTLLHAGGRPDAAWWQEHLQEQLWPGHGARRVGLGAEMCSQSHRAAWLSAAAPLGLTVYGDDGWRGLLPPSTRLLPPISYYKELPAHYHQAACTLNVTSLLLPHGLTQRHFDVWAAGGFLLTDATPGLDLFPQELTRPITVTRPDMLAERLAALPACPARTQDLRRAWQEEVNRRHTYTLRISKMLDALQKK